MLRRPLLCVRRCSASIDVSQVVPIRVTDKGGGSLRAKRNASPSRIYNPGRLQRPQRLSLLYPGAFLQSFPSPPPSSLGTFVPPASTRSVKTSQSFSANKINSSDAPPPVPPPFPKEILEPSKERVIFLWLWSARWKHGGGCYTHWIGGAVETSDHWWPH